MDGYSPCFKPMYRHYITIGLSIGKFKQQAGDKEEVQLVNSHYSTLLH